MLPPLVAILLCFLTKEVLLSLFVGILSGALIIVNGNPFAAIGYTLDTIVYSVSDEWNLRLLMFNLLMGSSIAFIWRLGGSRAIANWANQRLKTKQHAELGAWFLGFIIFFNDGINTAIVGNVFRDIFTVKKIPREKLSYIVDSTAAPISTFLISDWIAFQIGMIQTGLSSANIVEISAFTAYLKSMPLNIYSILAVLMVGIIIISKKDFGPMLNAEIRTINTGRVMGENAQLMLDVSKELGKENEKKPMLLTLFLPILVLTIVSLLGFWVTGRNGTNLLEVLEMANPAKALLWGAFSMMFTGVIIAYVNRLMNIKEIMATILDGMKLMLLACVILILAWSLGNITTNMKLADYLVRVIGGSFSIEILPLVVFILSGIIAFSTGTSWGTMTILTPIVIPLAYQMTDDISISVMMAGIVFSGAIFGDHCSPISDTTVLSSIFSGSDHMEHVNTQLPYALTVAFVTGILFLIWGYWGISPWILILVGLGILVGLTYLLNYIHKMRKIVI